MSIPATGDLTQVIHWLRGVSRDSRIGVLYRFALIGIGLHHRRDQPDAVASAIGLDRVTILRAIDIGIRRGWLADSPKAGGQVLFTFPARRKLPAMQGGQGVALLPRRAQ